ncbi:MAG: hypothetical protein ACQESM_09390 [Bacteroidota bacterium]
MSKYEIISSVISLLAVVVSFVALYRSKRNHDQVIELKKVHAKLSERQLAEFDKHDREAGKANLAVEMIKENNMHKFVITNRGKAEAKDIYFGLEEENEHNPLVGGDYEGKNPFKLLAPGDSYKHLAHIPISVRQSIYSVSLRWNNADGNQDHIFLNVAR